MLKSYPPGNRWIDELEVTGRPEGHEVSIECPYLLKSQSDIASRGKLLLQFKILINRLTAYQLYQLHLINPRYEIWNKRK